MKAVSLFANVGVAELFFDDLGIEIAVANEIDIKRAKFYSHVHKNTNMIQGDFTKKEIFETTLNLSKNFDIDLLIATPPCQGMSEAGKREEYDVRNQLILVFCLDLFVLFCLYPINVFLQLSIDILYHLSCVFRCV